MKLLITGGCGFLGSNLAARALDRGDDLLVFDNLERLGSGDNLAWLHSIGQFDFERSDIRDADAVERQVRRFVPDAVFHLAGQVAMTTSIADPRKDFEINALGTLNVLEAVRQYVPGAVVIYSSTNKVYGDLEQFTYMETESRYECVDRSNGFDESTALSFRSPYGCSKGAADQYMLDFARIYGLRTIVFRHSSLYGGRQYATYDQGWIGWFCQKALEIRRNPRSPQFEISGTGKQVRDVLHADDLVRLYFTALTKSDHAAGRAFNIGGGMSNSLSLLELFKLLETILGVTLLYTKQPPRKSDQRVFVADISRAKRALGWEPAIHKENGIRSMIRWLESLGYGRT